MQKSFTTLPTMVQYMVQTYRNSYAFNYRQDDQWYSMSTEVFCESVRRLALGLHDMGLKPGDKVGILARSSPFWLIVDMAVVTAGGVSVPMFAHVSEQNFLHEVKDSAMRYLFVVDGDQWAAVSHHRKLFEAVITHNVQHEQEGDNVHDFNDLLERGDTVSQNNPQLYAELRDRVDADELATIIYTSGSTGMPKGVELTHNNLISPTLDADKRFPMRPKTDRILSVLPLAHVFERMLMYYYMSKGLSIYFVDDIRNVGNIIRDVAPTACAMVPLL